MSMYRQFWLAIIVSMMLALLGSLLAATLSARSYLGEQLSMKNADNAAALALSLSQQQPDATMVELTASALFDSGHYESIRITDPFGNTLVERTAAAEATQVPDWFTRIFPIAALPGQAQITSGWKQIGTIELRSHSRFAYQSLWKSAWEMIMALILAGLVGGALGSLVIGRLKGSLDQVIAQAQAITERRFITIEEPSIPELHQLAAAMNTTVTRLKAMFQEEADRLENVRRDANCDPLTGLANRNNFMVRLRETLTNEDAAGGMLILTRVAQLAKINQRLGRKNTDELLQHLASIIADTVKKFPDGLGARLNGADFALLLPNVPSGHNIASDLMTRLVGEAHAFLGEAPTAVMGLCCYPPGPDAGAIMAQADAALATAESQGINTIHEIPFTHNEDIPRSAEEWAKLIKRAIQQHWVRLMAFPVVSPAGVLLHNECPLRLKLDEQDPWLPAGRFLPIAERLKLTTHLDLVAVTLGMEQLAKNPDAPDIAINLSAESIQNTEFRHKLLSLLQKKSQIASRLWLEVAETGALQNFEAFREFINTIRPCGCRLGIEHFGRQSSQIGLLHDLGLDYLKVDARFVHHLDNTPGNQAFLKGLAGIAHGIGLHVIAEGVADTDELYAVYAADFDGATGPAIQVG